MKKLLPLLLVILSGCAPAFAQLPDNSTVDNYLRERAVLKRAIQRSQGDGRAMNVNMDNLKRLQSDLAYNNLDIWFIGDDAMDPTIQCILTLNSWNSVNGTALGNGSSPYLGWSAGTIGNPASWTGANEPWPYYFGMASGSSLTNRWTSGNGISTTEITIYGWMSNGFGTLTVRTQSLIAGALGTPGNVLVIDCNNLTNLTGFATNIHIAAQPNLTASVYSSGTNMIYSIGQRNTNVGSGYVLTGFAGSNFDINNLMTNSVKSNTFRTWVSAWPPSVIVQYDKNYSNSLYNGIVSLDSLLTGAGLTTDYAICTTVPTLTDRTSSDGERQASLQAAIDTGRTALDTYGFFVPARADDVTYYQADMLHLAPTGHVVIGGKVAEWLKLRPFDRANYGRVSQATISNVLAASLTAPGATSDFILLSNSVSTAPGSKLKLQDGYGTPRTLSAGEAFVNLFYGSGNHGLGVFSGGGYTADFLTSDGNIGFAYMNGGAGTVRAIFDVQNNANYFAGTVAATNGFVLPPANVTLTADNQVIGMTTNSLFFIASDNATAANRTFVLTTGIPGKIVQLVWSGTNQGELVDDSANNGSGNVRLSAVWPTAATAQYDTLTLVAIGNDWYEVARSGN